MKLPRVDRRRVGGTVYKYHRHTRAKLPHDIPEDHPEFITAWTAEEARGAPLPKIGGKPGSIGAACKAYLASEQFLALSPDYRRAIRLHIERIATAYGPGQLRDLRERHLKADLSGMTANPARARRKAWRQLLTWSVEANLIGDDPSRSLAAPRPVRTDGHAPWTKSEIEAYRTQWPVTSPQRLAFELTYWTGARRNDVAQLHRRMIGEDGVLTFKQQKTGGRAYIPWTCALPAFADTATHAHLMACIEAQRPRLMLLETRTGKPRSGKAFGPWLATAARAAGVSKTAHGLRKSRLTQIAEDGGTVHAIMSWGGHKTLSEAQHYIETANRKQAVMGTEQDQNPAQDHDPAAQRLQK